MPEITFNFNVNINCDPKLLNFLEALQQRIKPEEPQEKIVSLSSVWPEPKIITSSVLIPEEKRTDNNYNSEPIEVICDRLIDFIKSKGGECPLYPNPGLNRTLEVYQAHKDLIDYCKCGAKKIIKALRKLDKEGKIEVFRDKSRPHNHPYSYRILEVEKKIESEPEISPPEKVSKKYHTHTPEDRLNQEEKLYNYIKEQGSCPIPYYVNPNFTTTLTKQIHTNLVNLLGNADNIKIALCSLINKKRVEKGKSGKFCIYKVNEKKIVDLTSEEVNERLKELHEEATQKDAKKDYSKNLKLFKDKVKKTKKEEKKFRMSAIYEEDATIGNLEDLEKLTRREKEEVTRDTYIEVPSLERGPKKEIKRKCSICQGQLFLKNTKEDNYLDCESAFTNLPADIYYECMQGGHTFSLEDLEKIERRKIESEAIAA